MEGGGLISVGGGGANFLDVFFCCLQVNGPVSGGNYKWGGRGLITADVLFCLQVQRPVTQLGCFSVGRGRGHS